MNYLMEDKAGFTNEAIPVPYPIIRASEILANPEEALDATTQATELLRKNDYELHNHKCAEALRTVSELKEQCCNFIDNFFAAKDVLHQPPSDLEDMASKEQLQVYLLQNMKIVADLTPGLYHSLKVLQSINTDMKNFFSL